MKSFFAALACAGFLAAPVLAAEKCTASADAVWDAGGEKVKIEAFASGDTCEKATAVLAVHDGTGQVIYSNVGGADGMMMLGEKKTSKELAAALAAWIDVKTNAGTTADLPEWKQGTEMPMRGEFPFYPADGIDRDTYEAARAAKTPMYCYVPGIETSACLIRDPQSEAIYLLGGQSFPG
ncbi:hypothetical protein sos41_14450 [Alphaproteobacteria bacterium SO-S41]|nr:hypothetical protein sos41_14450 [Alphaproteobacteria bacterium SO-S41]